MTDASLQARLRSFDLRRFVSENREVVTIYGIVLLIMGFGLVAIPDFRSARNFFNILRQAVALGMVSIGQTFVILAAGIDLSVGATISLIAVYTAGLMTDRSGLVPIIWITLAMIAVALAIGLFNGLVITELKVAPFIATLGTGSIVQGLVLLYVKRPSGSIIDGWEFFAEGRIGPVPFPVIFLLALLIVAAVLLTRTVLGRHVIATGGSQVIALWSGIRTKRVLLFAYMFCGFTAALTGLYLTSRHGVGDPLIGGLNYDRFDLDSITAVLLGGTRLGGGKGNVVGTIAGVLIVATLNNVFNLMGVNSYYQWIIKGFIVLAAVAVYAARKPGEGG
jgi:ribose transport system permease protein